MKVAVREGQCKGYGYCADLAPNVYELDTEGFNELAGREPRAVPAELEREAEVGIEACPLRAIVTDAGRG